MLSKFFNFYVGRDSLVAADDHWSLLMIVCVSVALAIFLEQKYRWASKVSGAIIALIIAMILANVGIIPLHSTLYDDVVWGIIVPMGIPLLLLECNLSRVWKDTGRMLIVYLIGAIGTITGGFAAYFLLRDPFGSAHDLAKVVSIMTGSYIGGGVNFAALASQYAAGEDLTASATVADNLLIAAYFFVLIAIAGMRFFRSHFTHPHIDAVEAQSNQHEGNTQAAAFWTRKDISLKDIAYNIAYCVLIVWLSRMVAQSITLLLPDNPQGILNFVDKFFGSQYVWITTFSVIVASRFSTQVQKNLHGSQEIGTFLIYLFLFVIGVPANIFMVLTQAPLLLVLTAIMVMINMTFCFVAAKLFHCNLEDAIIASNANIGGPTTAAGMAIAQGWQGLVGPAMLVGVLGYVIGNYAGTIVAIILGL